MQVKIEPRPGGYDVIDIRKNQTLKFHELKSKCEAWCIQAGHKVIDPEDYMPDEPVGMEDKDNMKTKLEWGTGAPPHTGWWNASVAKDPSIWRWWDGSRWSWPVHYRDSMECVRNFSRMKLSEENSAVVEWSSYWPPYAIVDRAGNPTEPHKYTDPTEVL